MRLGSPYDSFDDPYCYPGTSVLRNKLDLQDYEALEAFEHEAVSARGEESLPAGAFVPAHYCAIHHHLFQDVYEWAGQYRTVRTAKGGDMFCYPEYINGQMEALFPHLLGAPFHGDNDPNAFVSAAASFLADLNAIHPFREGNGRTQLTFLFLLGERAEIVLDMTKIRPVEMLSAMIASFNGTSAALEGEIARLVG
jgi:cell filamentation protein